MTTLPVLRNQRRQLLEARTCTTTGDVVSLWGVEGLDPTGKKHTFALVRTVHPDGTREVERTTLECGRRRIRAINQTTFDF